MDITLQIRICSMFKQKIDDVEVSDPRCCRESRPMLVNYSISAILVGTISTKHALTLNIRVDSLSNKHHYGVQPSSIRRRPERHDVLSGLYNVNMPT